MEISGMMVLSRILLISRSNYWLLFYEGTTLDIYQRSVPYVYLGPIIKVVTPCIGVHRSCKTGTTYYGSRIARIYVTLNLQTGLLFRKI